MRPDLDRILDANLNRAREGLRVGEELARLVLEDGGLGAAFKATRHGIAAAERKLAAPDLLRSRAAERDPGSHPQPRWENRRTDCVDLARANLRRAEEALRVLEEVSKLQSLAASAHFKRLRFRTYILEQKITAGLQAGTAGRRRSGRGPQRGKKGT